MPDQDLKILRKAVKGDRMAFRTLVMEHSQTMFRLAWRMTCDEHLAEDVVQDAFIKAYPKIGDFELRRQAVFWLAQSDDDEAVELLARMLER